MHSQHLGREIAASQPGGETGTLHHPSDCGSSELKLHKSCLCKTFYTVCSKVNWFKHHPYPGQSRVRGSGVPPASTEQSKWTFCTISGCKFPPLGMGPGRAKTLCRTQNILKYLVQCFILVETCLQQKIKTSQELDKKKEAECFQGGWWDFGFVFSLDTSPVSSSPELAMVPRDVAAKVVVPIHGLI